MSKGSVVTYRKSDRVVGRTIDGEHFLVPISGTSADLTSLYLLNETAAAAWELLTAPQDIDTLCSLLQQEFDVPAEALRADIEELLRELEERRLITMEARVG
jgi:hypothetical protein